MEDHGSDDEAAAADGAGVRKPRRDFIACFEASDPLCPEQWSSPLMRVLVEWWSAPASKLHDNQQQQSADSFSPTSPLSLLIVPHGWPRLCLAVKL